MVGKRSYQGQNQEQKSTPKDIGSIKNDITKNTPKEIKRNNIDRGKEQLKSMRDRLYSRAVPPKAEQRHVLSGSEAAQKAATFSGNRTESPRIDEKFELPQAAYQWPPAPLRDTMRTDTPLDAPSTMSSMPQRRKITLKGYRTKIIAVAVIFFVVALVLSSSFLFFGQNTISGDNIAIDVQAPFTIGGGEELLLQVGVTNRNSVAVESATLIVEYPPGTQEVGTAVKELFRERVPLGSIKSGEVLQIPVKARIFGEENEEKTISISVEYRVQGSNATFFKEAEPLRLKISSSPVVLSIDAIKEVSSGQEVELTLMLASNSPSPITDLLVQAEYPFGFDFSESNPRPVKGQNLWSITSLPPGGKEKITIKGVMVGGNAEERTFDFSVGVPSERDRFSLASVFTNASTEIKLTDPFVGLKVVTNGSIDQTVSLKQSDAISVSITFKNTLSDTIYDGTIKAVLSGNGLNASNVNTSNGFYDSTTHTITWDKVLVKGLRELAPGAQETVTFTISGADLDAARTPQVSYDVSVTGRRVSESRVPQQLTKIESRTIRFESVVSLSSHGLYSIGPFTNTGPTPPHAETVTQYSIILAVRNGSNELTDATASMTLPSYVTWSDVSASGDNITYNANTREVMWHIRNLDANASANTAFQVAFLPSISQVGTVPTLVSEQSLRATDRFTGTVIRATADALTTHLPEDPDADAQVGRVLPKD